MKKCIVLALLAAGLATGVGAAAAEGPATHPGLEKLLGIVKARGFGFAAGVSGFGKLRYHSGGQVMHTNKTYAIYWFPAGSTYSANYKPLIDRFLGDVAADSGKSSNVYYSDTQYYDVINSVTTHVAYSSTFGGSTVDTNPFPASGCTDSVAETSVCLSDAQLQTEIQRVKTSQGWTSDPSTLFFMFTPKGVGSCSGSSCAFSQYCAYHSWYGSGSTVTLYANQPYTMTVASGCDSKQHPNGDDADPTINVVSHEHNEAITDEQGNAWYDWAGYENGDKCAWNFGTALGSTAFGQYNQVINGDKYYLQQEYSNARSNCVLTGT